MKFAFCPADPTHRRFSTTIHVTQTVLVAPNGEFLEELTSCDEVTHGPDPDNIWTCATCGALAKFREDEADEVGQEDLEAASEVLAKLEAGKMQCGCDPSSCDHKYLGDEPGPYPRDRREKKGARVEIEFVRGRDDVMGPILGPFDYAQTVYLTLTTSPDGIPLALYIDGDWRLEATHPAVGPELAGQFFSDFIVRASKKGT